MGSAPAVCGSEQARHVSAACGGPGREVGGQQHAVGLEGSREERSVGSARVAASAMVPHVAVVVVAAVRGQVGGPVGLEVGLEGGLVGMSMGLAVDRPA